MVAIGAAGSNCSLGGRLDAGCSTASARTAPPGEPQPAHQGPAGGQRALPQAWSWDTQAPQGAGGGLAVTAWQPWSEKRDVRAYWSRRCSSCGGGEQPGGSSRCAGDAAATPLRTALGGGDAWRLRASSPRACRIGGAGRCRAAATRTDCTFGWDRVSVLPPHQPAAPGVPCGRHGFRNNQQPHATPLAYPGSVLNPPCACLRLCSVVQPRWPASCTSARAWVSVCSALSTVAATSAAAPSPSSSPRLLVGGWGQGRGGGARMEWVDYAAGVAGTDGVGERVVGGRGVFGARPTRGRRWEYEHGLGG